MTVTRAVTLLAVVCSLVSFAHNGAAETVYDLVDDWSDLQNPNGPWSYNEDGATLLPTHVEDWSPACGLQPAWVRDTPSQPAVPVWYRAVDTCPELDYVTGDVVIHSGNGVANVTWTSPADGIVDISGLVWNVRTECTVGCRVNRWTLLVDGQELALGGLVSSDPVSHPRSSPFHIADGATDPTVLLGVPVAVGSTIALAFERLAPAFTGDFFGVNLTIEFSGTVNDCEPPPAGLVNWWSGDVDASDIAGADTGTLIGDAVPGAPGIVGGAFSFDGLGDYMDFGSAVIPVGAKTVSVWVKTSATNVQEIYSNEGADSSNLGSRLQIRSNTGQVVFTIRKGTGGQDNFEIVSDASVNDGAWHHIAATWGGTTNANDVKLYIDGILDSTGTAVQTESGPASENLRIGAISGPTLARFFDGSLDEIAVFDRALTVAEVQAIFVANDAGICKDEPPPLALNAIGNQSGFEGQLLSFSVSATGGLPPLSFSSINLPPGSFFDPLTAEFSWTPAFDQAGNYTDIEFSVSDSSNPINSDIELVTISVGDVNRPPVFDPVGPQAVEEGVLLEFYVTAQDPDMNAVMVDGQSLPPGANFDGLSFTWVPTFDQAGVYPVEFKATDSGSPGLDTSISVVITVGNTSSPGALLDYIGGQVVDLALPQGVQNPLINDLKNAEKHIEKDRPDKAIDKLNKFIIKILDAIEDGDIDNADGDALISLAEELITLLA